MLEQNNELVLIDFGLSKKIESQVTETYNGISKTTSTGFTGTLAYMAPELMKKRKRGEQFAYDPFKSDMWSLGVTLY